MSRFDIEYCEGWGVRDSVTGELVKAEEIALLYNFLEKMHNSALKELEELKKDL